MARTANPLTKVIKKFALLQKKSDKLNQEIATFAKFIESEKGMPKKAAVEKVAKPAKPKSRKRVAKKAPASSKAAKAKKAVGPTIKKPAAPAKKTPAASAPKARVQPKAKK